MIGEIIKEQRLLQKMSRKTLSEEICSEKYIYLIEKNERNPSAYILNSFSDRLGVDLFQYYQYINYGEKNKVFKHRENFERYQQTSNIQKLKEESMKAEELKDFQIEPLKYDIIVIDSLYQTTTYGKTQEVINNLNEIIELEELNIDPITLVNAYIVLSTAYQIEGQWEQAEKAVITAYDMIKHKTGFDRYNTVIITVLISYTSLLYNMDRYEELIEFSEVLKDFQEKYSEYNRFYYVEYYLAFAYYKMGNPEKARVHFMSGSYSALLFKNKVDIEYITQMNGFKKIVEDLEIDTRFIEQIYNLIDSPIE